MPTLHSYPDLCSIYKLRYIPLTQILNCDLGFNHSQRLTTIGSFLFLLQQLSLIFPLLYSSLSHSVSVFTIHNTYTTLSPTRDRGVGVIAPLLLLVATTLTFGPCSAIILTLLPISSSLPIITNKHHERKSRKETSNGCECIGAQVACCSAVFRYSPR